ncbi:5'-nucleotidase C-terminal domain-containing protein [Micromonospora taraxaci]|uniref:5'-nucleotidase C-terminal domain-containing protein n=1 Tax=Micromonospora taraxaci TaxID=1316803 RepID=UPI0033BABEB3
MATGGRVTPFLHLGVSKGSSYVYDPNESAGNRVIADRIFLNGTVPDPNATYRVTVNSFLASGGDNFGARADGDDQFASGDNDLTVLVDYFRAKSPVTADTVERAYTVGQPGAPVAGGDPGSADHRRQGAHDRGRRHHPAADGRRRAPRGPAPADPPHLGVTRA